MNYHIAKKHSEATARVVHKCKIWDKKIHSFYKLQQHRRNEQAAQRDSGSKNVHVAQVMRNVYVNNSNEELETRKHFFE